MKKTVNFRNALRKITALLTAVFIVVSLFTLVACNDKGTEGEKNITFVLIKEDKSEKVFNITTNEETLALALVEEGIVEYSESGMYTVFDGIEANYSDGGAWWCITKDGNEVFYGMNELYLQDGDKYEATFTR